MNKEVFKYKLGQRVHWLDAEEMPAHGDIVECYTEGNQITYKAKGTSSENTFFESDFGIKVFDTMHHFALYLQLITWKQLVIARGKLSTNP